MKLKIACYWLRKKVCSLLHTGISYRNFFYATIIPPWRGVQRIGQAQGTIICLFGSPFFSQNGIKFRKPFLKEVLHELIMSIWNEFWTKLPVCLDGLRLDSRTIDPSKLKTTVLVQKLAFKFSNWIPTVYRTLKNTKMFIFQLFLHVSKSQ